MIDTEATIQRRGLRRHSLSAGAASGRVRFTRPALGTFAWSALALLACVLALATVSVTDAGLQDQAVVHGGPFWGLYPAWLAVGLLVSVVLFAGNGKVRALALLAVGVVVMGLLGVLEPYGVFHDSWRNLGLGQLALQPAHAAAAYSDAYLSSSPLGFLLLGVLRFVFPNTPLMLQLYPLLSMVAYTVGVYAMALALADTHLASFVQDRDRAQYRVRFAQYAALAFLASASIFSVRINPAPQSLAFAILPFFLAAVLRGKQSRGYRLTALALFSLLILTHPVTALMSALLCAAFFVADLPFRRGSKPVISLNSVALYGSLFVAWLIYVGVWVLKSSNDFLRRVFSALDSGQAATVTASGSAVPMDFIWTHRIAMFGIALLVLGGLIVAWKVERAASMRLLAWFGVSAAWLPFMFFGEFADRGPLFASLPAAIAVAFLLNMRGTGRKARLTSGLASVAMLATAVTAFATSYSNHIGEVIAPAEVEGFHAIVAAQPEGKIVYGYVPPFAGEDLPIYTSGRIRAYALGAADADYSRLLRQNGVIVVSTAMDRAAASRGPEQQGAYKAFLAQLSDARQYELIYSNSFVRAYLGR